MENTPKVGQWLLKVGLELVCAVRSCVLPAASCERAGVAAAQLVIKSLLNFQPNDTLAM